MVKIRFVIATLALLVAGAAFAQQMPPGRWWQRPDVVERLQLTQEQQSRLDAVWTGAASDLIDAKAEMDKAEVALRAELDQASLNRANVQKVVARLNEARSRRFAREMMMLVDMRGILTEQQWTRMRTELDRMKQQKQQQQQDMPLLRPRMKRQ